MTPFLQHSLWFVIGIPIGWFGSRWVLGYLRKRKTRKAADMGVFIGPPDYSPMLSPAEKKRVKAGGQVTLALGQEVEEGNGHFYCDVTIMIDGIESSVYRMRWRTGESQRP